MAYVDRSELYKLFDDSNGVVRLHVADIDMLPTAKVTEVKHGEWIVDNSERDWKDKDTYKLLIKCSECGKTHFLGTTRYQNEYNSEKLKTLGTYDDYTFCGKCGAKMHD